MLAEAGDTLASLADEDAAREFADGLRALVEVNAHASCGPLVLGARRCFVAGIAACSR